MRGVQVGRRAILAVCVAGVAAHVVPVAAQLEPVPTMPPPAPTESPAPVFTPYTDPLNRFALSVPEGWVPLRPTVAEIIGAWGASDDPAATFLVIRLPVPQGTSGEGFAGGYLAAIRALPGYGELGYRLVTIAEQEVPLLDYTVPEDDTLTARVMRVQQIFLTQNAEGTILSFRCPYDASPRYAVPVGGMVASFTL